MTFRVLVSDPISDEGLAPLRENPHFEVIVKPGLKGADLLQALEGCQALMVRSETKVTAEVLAAAKGLRFVGRAGTGVDNIDIAAATRLGVVVANVPGGNTISAAEQSLALLFSLARNIPQAHASTKAGRWERSRFVGTELTGKALGVLGLGRIGREVATRAIGLGMNVLGYDPQGDDSWCRRAGVQLLSLENVLARADFITVHVPLTAETKGLLNDATLAKTKKGVRIINCARGGIVDEAALLRALESGQVKGAALDVFEKEPVPADHPLLSRPDVVVTPHLGASTEEAQVKVATELSEALVDFFERGYARQAVNLPPLEAAPHIPVGAFVSLADRLGRFLAQITDGPCSTLTLRYMGELGRVNPALLTATAVAGFLSAKGAHATPVNARVVASEKGLVIKEDSKAESRDYASLLELSTDGGRLAGTVYGRGDLRLVRVNDLTVEVIPEGSLLVMTNDDRPGVVGHTGTVLAAAGINIAGLDVGRQNQGGLAVSIWRVDAPVPEAVIQQVKAHPAVRTVRMVSA